MIELSQPLYFMQVAILLAIASAISIGWLRGIEID